MLSLPGYDRWKTAVRDEEGEALPPQLFSARAIDQIADQAAHEIEMDRAAGRDPFADIDF